MKDIHPSAHRGKTAARKLLFGINDVQLGEKRAQPAVAPLKLDRYGMTVLWKPGQKVTGQEFGDAPASQPIYAIVQGNAGATPRTNAQRAEFANYVRALTKAHPNIKEVQVWNEPSLKYNWDKTAGKYSYESLLAKTFDRMRGSKVSIAAPGQYPAAGNQIQFVRRIGNYMHQSQRNRPLFNIFASHPYWDANKSTLIEKVMNRRWAGTAQASPDRGMKIWWTETGLNAPHAGATPGTYTGTRDSWVAGNEQQQVDRMNQLGRIARKDPAIGAMFNFLLYDESNLSRWQSGLLDPTGATKPAFLAYQNLIAQTRAQQGG